MLDSAPLYLLDSETKEIRTASTKDLVEIIKLVDNLEYVPCMTACVVPDDVPVSICDVIRFHQTLVYSNKPVFGGAFSIDGLLAEIELLSVLAGGKEKMRERPRVFMAANPSAPLMWTQTSAGNLVDCAKNDSPVMIIPIPLSGGSVPVTLAVDFIKENKHNSSNIIGSEHTLDWFKKELFYPSHDIISRASYSQHVKMGGGEMFDRAREKKVSILENYKPPAIDPHTLDEMKRILIDYAENKGETIPEFIFDVRFDV